MSDMECVRVPQEADLHPEQVDPMAWAAGVDQPGQDPGTIRVQLFPDMAYQRLAGIGGAFSEIGAAALWDLPAAEREAALDALFAPSGAGFTRCRTPVGASDFALDAYSLCDHPGDRDMEHFSIARDHSGILRFILAAARRARDLRLHASPWSPPAWLKDNDSMVDGGSLRDDPGLRRAYADYLVRFVRAYRQAGAQIDRLMPQNEPDIATRYPSCVMLPRDMIPFVVEHLAPALAAGEPDCAVWAGAFRMVGGAQAHECLHHDAFRDAVAGAGFQYSRPQSIRDLAVLHPGLQVMHTESVCYDGSNSWLQAARLFEDVLAYLRAGCDSYSYWNMVLDETGRSHWGWRQNALITVDRAAGTWRPNPDHAVMRLFAADLIPGARRIEAFCFQRPCLAVRRPDGGIALFTANHGGEPAPLVVICGGNEQRLELPPHSMVALRW